MTIFTKIIASIGLFMLYGFINQMVLMASGRNSGPSAFGTVLALGFLAGVVAIWRSKSKKDVGTGDKLDKTDHDTL